MSAVSWRELRVWYRDGGREARGAYRMRALAVWREQLPGFERYVVKHDVSDDGHPNYVHADHDDPRVNWLGFATALKTAKPVRSGTETRRRTEHESVRCTTDERARVMAAALAGESFADVVMRPWRNA